jgi:hypothetical protein
MERCSDDPMERARVVEQQDPLGQYHRVEDQ